VSLLAILNVVTAAYPQERTQRRHTEVSIVADSFHINGRPTYEGRTASGHKIEGLLFNSRMVQGIFDDLNPDTVKNWAYPDTGKWDAERNTREFIAAMPSWREHGLLAFTIDLQGGNPRGYGGDQPWHNSAFTREGNLRPAYFQRLERIINKADELGMVVILGVFYFGQDERLEDEDAVKHALDLTVQWVFNRYMNVLIEVNNECNVRYDHAILRPDRVHELIERAKDRSRDGWRLLVGTSYGGGAIPEENVVRASDFLLLHGNGVGDPKRIAEMVQKTRKVPGYRPMPILFNEDDHFDFDKPENNFSAAIGEYASWGYFDFRMKEEGFDDGYQSVPVNWGISSPRKKAFFAKLKEITGARTGEQKPPPKSQGSTIPGTNWETVEPAAAGLAAGKLKELAALIGGRGCVVRHGKMTFTWGDPAKSSDLASAAKPVISTLMLMAVAEGKIPSPDSLVADFEPRLKDLNGGKDATITWRHLASQTSGYGLTEAPGAAYGYNDFALALYYQVLTDKVFRAAGTDVIASRLARPLEFEDRCEFDCLGPDRPGRLCMSMRDFARFGLLYLRGGRWKEKQILPAEFSQAAISSPIAADTPLTAGQDADMLPGQKSMGGSKNITRVGPGYYSFNWWLNAQDREGHRLYAPLPADAYAAAGHGGQKMLWVVPSLDLVVCWNTDRVKDHDQSPRDPNTLCNQAARLLMEAVSK
jgi:CubicO group peptidase (beta-lactamase class C family)